MHLFFLFNIRIPFFQSLIERPGLTIAAFKKLTLDDSMSRPSDINICDVPTKEKPVEQMIGVATAKVKHRSLDCFFECVGYHNLEGYISTIGVIEEYRKQGLGSLLLEEICNRLQTLDCTQFSLHVKSDNFPATSFYLKHGFTIVEHLDHYYEIDGKLYDAYRMERAVNDKKTLWVWFRLWKLVCTISIFIWGLPKALLQRTLQRCSYCTEKSNRVEV